MHFTIWHLDTGNLIGDYPTEDAALAAVRAEILVNESPDHLVLQREHGGDDPEFVASGQALAISAFAMGRPSSLPDRLPAGS